jgi:hypothetical protein
MSYQNQPYQQGQGQQYNQNNWGQHPQQHQQYGQQYNQHGYGQQQQPQQYGQQQYNAPPPSHSPQPQHNSMSHNTTPTKAADAGTFNGGSYKIDHRDTNSILTITLQPNAPVRSVSGAMIHMSASVVLSGKIKFSMKKMFITGGDMAESTYTGPGVVALAPTLPGDIFTLPVDGSGKWKVGKDAWLGCTQGVTRETKSQGIGKALFSGEDLFVYHVMGQGLAWLTSFGAVERLDVSTCILVVTVLWLSSDVASRCLC